jgi:hypothetical protein
MLRRGKYKYDSSKAGAELPGTTLAEMYHTEEPFLEGISIPVIARKFNYIATEKGKGDPAYMLSEPYNPFNVKTIEYKQHAVKSDFPKRNAYGGSAVLWDDGDYDDIRKAMDMDYDEKQIGLKKAFKPSEIVNYLREEAENNLTNAMREYYIDAAKNDEESKRYFLEQYGLTPDETNELMRQKKVEAAAEALNRRISNPKRLDPSRQRLAMVVEDYSRGDIPMVAMNARTGIGSFDLGVSGLMAAPKYQSKITAAGRRAASYGGAVQDALSGLPDRTLAQSVEAKKALLSERAAEFTSGLRRKEGFKILEAAREARERTETTASMRAGVVGTEEKREIVRKYAEERGMTLERAEARLKGIAKGAAGRKSGGGAGEKGQMTIAEMFGAGRK